MKFIISSPVLLKNLDAIKGVIQSNNTLPILDNFLFELDDNNSLKVTASDLETTMSFSLEIDNAEEPGSIAIPAKMLIDILKTFPDIPVTIDANPSTGLIEISTGEGRYKLSGSNAAEYPRLPKKEELASIKINTYILASAINKTIFAAGNDDLRPVMSGVYCMLDNESMTFVATDAHKLVRYRRKDVKSDQVASFILPKKPLNQIKNILTTSDEDVLVEYNQTNAFFSFKNIQLVCRLVEGRYPNYEAVIPNENPNKMVVDKHLFLNSIKRVSIFANQSTYQVRFKISGQELIMSAEDLDYSNEAKERMTCSFDGEDMEIGFNSRFMLEMLNNIDTQEVRLEMSAPNRAGILTPLNTENTEEDILMLVMPVMLNN